jgi:predicted RNase H-like nuclease (RuvC/YqgF family)
MTKAFVVAAAVLCVGLSALVIAYAVNTDRIAADYRNMASSKAAADAAVSAANASASQRASELQGQLVSLQQANQSAVAKTTELEAERASLINEKNKAESARQALESKIAESTETQKSLVALVTSYREEVTKLRDNELSSRRAMLDLDDRINDLESQRQVLEQNVRALQEQLSEARKTADATASGKPLAGVLSADQPYQYSGPIINGRVEDVQKDPGSTNLLAKLSVGTNSRVAKNMIFYITRGSEFIGKVIVSETDLGWSVGRVDTLGRSVDVRSGDTISSRL